MVVLVSGIGALILLYCIGYFGPRTARRRPRIAGLLLAFAGAMLGLVLADDLLPLYVFWELTIGHLVPAVGQSGERGTGARPLQALLVTCSAGWRCSPGFILLGEAAGTYRISEIVAGAAGGRRRVAAALALILRRRAYEVGASARSTPGCPAAMAAPTPVSAYLHAASMVKAGVYLVARLAPGVRRRRPSGGCRSSPSGWPRCCSAAGGPCARTTSSGCSPSAPSASWVS